MKKLTTILILLMLCVPTVQGSLIDDIRDAGDSVHDLPAESSAEEAYQKAKEAARKAAYVAWLSYMTQTGLYDRLFRLYRPWLIVR